MLALSIPSLSNTIRYPRFSADAPSVTDNPYQHALPYDQTAPGELLDSFVVIGDDGFDNEVHQKLVWQMLERHSRKPFTTLIRLGDNVYGPGESHLRNPLDGDPSLFMSRLVEPFRKLFDKGVRIFSILGNHDVNTAHEEEQLQFVNLPRYYNFRRGNVEFFALDTTVFFPGYDRCYNGRENQAKQLGDDQLKWLDETLAKSKAKYKVVMGHYPMYNSAKFINRGRNGLILRLLLEPLLVKHKVDMYLCGHEHHYERSAPIYGVHHFMSGSGSLLTDEIRHVKDPPYPRRKLLQQHQFMAFTETPQGLSFEVIDPDGKIIDRGRVPAKHKPGLDNASLVKLLKKFM